MKKIFTKPRIIIGIILLCGALFFLFQIGQYFKIGMVANVQIFTEPKMMYGNEKCYENNQKLYVVDDATGTIHIFNENGAFLNGIQLPTSGGAVWSGVGNIVYAYCVRKDLLVEITDAKNISQKEVYFSNPDEFYNSLNITDKNVIDIDGNIVHITNNNNDEVVLDVESCPFPINISIILFLVCILAYLAISMRINIKGQFNELYRRRK